MLVISAEPRVQTLVLRMRVGDARVALSGKAPGTGLG